MASELCEEIDPRKCHDRSMEAWLKSDIHCELVEFSRRPTDFHGSVKFEERRIWGINLLNNRLTEALQADLISGGISGGPAAYRYHGKGPKMGSIGNGRSSASF